MIYRIICRKVVPAPLGPLLLNIDGVELAINHASGEIIGPNYTAYFDTESVNDMAYRLGLMLGLELPSLNYSVIANYVTIAGSTLITNETGWTLVEVVPTRFIPANLKPHRRR